MEPFKNIYNEEKIRDLSKEIKEVYPTFDQDHFIASIINDTWISKEFKQRLRTITQALGECLPNDYLKSLNILQNVHMKFDGLFHLIFPDFVEVFGLDSYNESINALKLFTKNCSSEFAIRPFLIKYPKSIEELKKWAKDDCCHIRRLASEGCRPRLPWGMALKQYKKDPSEVLEVLELLQNDNSEYVRKSVANNLNDISKDNPEVAIKIFKKWYRQSKEKDWIVKHGARTLLKNRNSGILKLFGYSPLGIKVSDLHLDTDVKINEYFNFSFKVSSNRDSQKLRVEYKIGLLRQKNKMNYKVFKLSERILKQQQITITKSHHFKEVTTRKYYSGVHSLTIIINGKEFETKNFNLTL